jgi:outer membrane protein assembly factor BamB
VSGFQLIPGVVIDPNRREAYVMSPEGDIVALDLADGAQLWRSADAAKPLALAGNVLVSQAEATGAPNELKIVGLDTLQQGRPVVERSVELPPGVRPMIGEVANKSFTADAEIVAGDAAVSWEFVERPRRGVAPGNPEVLPGEATVEVSDAAPALAAISQARSEATVTKGTFHLGLAPGLAAAEQVDAPQVRIQRAGRAPDLPAAAGMPEAEGTQFLSADGRHVLSSRRIADDDVWEKYLWTIFERATGQRLGEFKTHMSYAPFLVVDSRVIYETGPYALRTDTGIAEEPLQIRAVDLQTGRRLWNQPVRETADLTPPPP